MTGNASASKEFADVMVSIAWCDTLPGSRDRTTGENRS